MPLLGRARSAVAPAVPRGAARPEPGVETVSSGWMGGIPGPVRTTIFSACANPQCRSGWLHLWRRREAPVFEGGWCCSAACTAARVRAALDREMDAEPGAGALYRHRIPLGLAMLEQGWITAPALRSALAAQRAAGTGRLGAWLTRQRSVGEEQVTRVLGMQWGCPVLGVESRHAQALTALVPRLFADAFAALPLRLAAGRILYLGFGDRPDRTLALAVERITGLRVESGLVRESLFGPAHARLLEGPFPAAELMETATVPALGAALARALERTQPVEARLVRVHDCFWLRMWLRPQVGPLPDVDSVRDLIVAARAH